MDEMRKAEDTVTATEVRPEQTVTPPKKKANVALVVIGVLFGIGALCAVCGGIAAFTLYKGIQNGEQATTLKSLFTALNEGDKAKVITVSGEELATDLFADGENGTSLASMMKGSYTSMTITSVNVENDKATIEFTIKGTGTNKSLIESITYAELQKDDSGWFVTYFGQKDEE
jgi:hypothetical protein